VTGLKPGRGRPEPYLIGAIGLLAFGLRCLYIRQISHAPFFDLRIGDASEFHIWAQSIAAGDWLGTGVFYVAPLYPYLVALIYRTLGDGVTTLRLIQAAVGGCSCAVLAAAGTSLFGRRGAIAGLMLAVYPPAIFLDGVLEKSCLTTFFITALLYFMATVEQSAGSRWRLLLIGIVLGLLALTRENALVLIAPVLVWAATAPGFHLPASTSQWLARTSYLLAGCALVLLPVGIRNYAVGGEFHLTSSQFGPNFYIGNHPGASGTYDALVAGHGSWTDERDDARRLAEQAGGRALSAAEISTYWTTRAVDFIESRPLDWLRLLLRKLTLTFNAAEISDTESEDVYAEWSSLIRALQPFSFGVLFAMAAFGSVATAASWRRLWFLYAIGATYAASVVMFYVFARYRFPLVPVLTLLAAGGIAQLPARRRGALALAVAAGVVAFAFSQVPLENPRAARAVHYSDIAVLLSKDPARADDAMAFYARALEAEPALPAARFGVGTWLARSGRSAEAIPYYRAALAAAPEAAEIHYNLALALAATGQPEEAAVHLEEALRIRPDDRDARVALAKVQNNLGGKLASDGHIAEAVPYFQRALELNPDDENVIRNLAQAKKLLGRE
jgi:tetratricopeptide (TPR) repeat protein